MGAGSELGRYVNRGRERLSEAVKDLFWPKTIVMQGGDWQSLHEQIRQADRALKEGDAIKMLGEF